MTQHSHDTFETEEVHTIQVLAYTRIGDVALSSPPIQVTTFEDVPHSNISPDVSFKPYIVTYHLHNDETQ